jgi:phosphopentomutase
MIKRTLLLILDSLGVGELPDAGLYGDEGSNTLGNMARVLGGLTLPHFEELGLGNIIPIQGVKEVADCKAAWGKMAEKSRGKDTTTGHWEMMGIVLKQPFPVYPNGFPPEVLREFEAKIGRKTLGNIVASGTVIIQELGAEHLKTGYPIVYTSADSVFQIAAHEDVIPVDELYDMCLQARRILTGEHSVGRVIARPFVGIPGAFERTDRRKDFSVEPPGLTVLDHLVNAGMPVTGIGKIHDVFAGKGITDSIHSHNNTDGINIIMNTLATQERGLIFANLVDFDMKYGHRNDPVGYYQALAEVDRALPGMINHMRPHDALIITGDHGCDPTTPSTDHSREYVPLLVMGPGLKPGVRLGIRDGFSDLGKSIADMMGVETPGLPGTSFADLVL